MESDRELLLRTDRFDVVRHILRSANGQFYTKDTIQHPGSVAIVPLVDENRICLIRNRRVAVGQVLLELPAGTLDRREELEAAARRELEEETGYRAESIVPLTQLLMSPGILNERMHLFVATGLQPGPTALEQGEEIQNLIVTCDEALGMIAAGRIQDAKTVAGLLFFERFRRQ